MNAGDFAAQVLAGGASEIGSAALSVLAWIGVAVGAWTALCAVVMLPLLALRWHLGRRSRRMPFPKEEVGEPVIDDMLPAVFERRTQPAPWPDGDTFVADDVPEALRRMLEEDGRG